MTAPWQGLQDRLRPVVQLKQSEMFVVVVFLADVHRGDAESGIRAALLLCPRSEAVHQRRPEAAAEDAFASQGALQYL